MKNELSKKIKAIVAKPYARRLTPDEGGGYLATIQEFPGCIAEGDTPEEAIKNLDKAAASWILAALSTGYEIREPVSFYGFSGKIALRIPRGLHKQVAELSELEECSVNQLLVNAISQYVGGVSSFRRLSEIASSEIRKVVTDGFISLCRNGPASFTISYQPHAGAMAWSGSSIEGKTTEKIINMVPKSITSQYLLGVQP